MVNPSKSLYSTEQGVQWLLEIAEALLYMHSLTPVVCLYAQHSYCHLRVLSSLYIAIAKSSVSKGELQFGHDCGRKFSTGHIFKTCSCSSMLFRLRLLLQVVHRDLKLENILLSEYSIIGPSDTMLCKQRLIAKI